MVAFNILAGRQSSDLRNQLCIAQFLHFSNATLMQTNIQKRNEKQQHLTLLSLTLLSPGSRRWELVVVIAAQRR